MEKTRNEILDILYKKRQELCLSFEEESHKYTMKDLNGNINSNWISVSRVLEFFYDKFDSEAVAERISNGDIDEKNALLDSWRKEAEKSVNLGSMVHYNMEKISLDMFDIKKDVRKPDFKDADEIVARKMINAGTNFINTMIDRGCMLLDTEMVLGSPELGYTGQPDTVWLFKYKGEIGLIITDYKTNKPKNFKIHHYTISMNEPFNYLPNNALGHYYLQLPFYGKLILDMLKGSKYENIKIFTGIIVHLKANNTFKEYKVPRKVFKTIFDIDISKYKKSS